MLLLCSATSLDQLVTSCKNKQQQIQATPTDQTAPLINQLNTKAHNLPYKKAFYAPDATTLNTHLETFTSQCQPTTTTTHQPKRVFLCTGQGAQYPNMGLDLYQNYPTFRNALDQCTTILTELGLENLLDYLFPTTNDESAQIKLNQTEITQPALFAFEYAMAQLWHHYGIHADAYLGHSVGEYVAATLAHVMSLEEGLHLIHARAKLMQNLPRGGGMTAVMANATTLAPLVKNHQLDFAGFNGHKQTVISGPLESLQTCQQTLKEQGIRSKALQVSHAFHSRLMDPMLDPFKSVAAQINYKPANKPIATNVDGTLAHSTTYNADYWCQHVRQGVHFIQGVEQLTNHNHYDQWIELGPQPILIGMCQRLITTPTTFLASVKPKQANMFEQNLAQAYTNINFEPQQETTPA
jgi:acyl transferase domain-containing protein